MIRVLLIGGALMAMTGASAYYGMGRGWGGPVALVGLTAVGMAIAGHSLDEGGATRWMGLLMSVSAFVLVAALSASALGVVAARPRPSGAIAALFIVFAATTCLYGVTGVLLGTIPTIAAVALAAGAPLLALGVWQERLGDIGFLVTVVGLVLLGATADTSSPGPG